VTITEAMQRVDPTLPPGARALRIALLREDRPAAWLARRLAVNKASVGGWTRGEHNPSPEHRTLIHQLLGIDPAEWSTP